jgi:hypothetical protein
MILILDKPCILFREPDPEHSRMHGPQRILVHKPSSVREGIRAVVHEVFATVQDEARSPVENHGPPRVLKPAHHRRLAFHQCCAWIHEVWRMPSLRQCLRRRAWSVR